MKEAGWWLASFIVGLLVIYVVGVAARGHYGIRVLIDNHSEQVLRHVSPSVESAGARYDLGNLALGMHKHIFTRQGLNRT